MNLKTYAEKNGYTLDEAKELTGLTHWNSTVPEILAEVELIETESKEDTVPLEEFVELAADDPRKAEIADKAKKLRTYIGEKSYEYLRFVDDHKEVIPEEYERAKELIKDLL